ncbi:L1Tco protein [Trypanosoma theileri]|uniref:L1Tco protein n=1 Tax=Trypanosoma theileri TaxID=67003 RepID=A0A1X0NW70_9TRYP|nr:L1Tco protein [Trypanosoma theileri]ORC88945.1 L1Tco protein [Trypanosoma theileri]
MFKEGPTVWDKDINQAEHNANLLKTRYLNLPTLENQAAMQQATMHCLEAIRSKLTRTFHHRLSKLNPGDHLSWKYISACKRATPPSSQSIILSVGKKQLSTSRQTANALNRHFFPPSPRIKPHRFSRRRHGRGQQSPSSPSSLFSSLGFSLPSIGTQNSFFTSDADFLPTSSSSYSSPLDAPFRMAELLAAIRDTPSGKAPGPDEIYSEPLHHLSDNGRKFVLKCINQSWQTGIIPAQWRCATVVPLLKPGKAPENPSSYRPISLTSILCKVAEKMVLRRLLWVWTPHPHQYAYRSMHTTAMQLAHLVDTVEHNRNEYFDVRLNKRHANGVQIHYRPHRTLLILIDFSRAFDSINHRVLSERLAHIPGTNCRRWLRNLLCDRFARTRVGNTRSKKRNVSQGVPQGSVVGPYLFSLYVHPLLNLLNDSAEISADMYADDLSIIIKGQSREEAIPKVNLVLRQLHEWSIQNDLLVNPLKCEAVWFTMSTHTEDDRDPDDKHKLIYNGHEIPVSTMGSTHLPKLLGLPLDPRLSFNTAANAQSAATSTRIAQLKCVAHKSAGPRPHDMRTFVIGYGSSKLLYGRGLTWALSDDTAKNALMRTQASLARIVSGVPSTTDPESALLEANMMPLHIIALGARFALFERVRACHKDWYHPPPPEPPPRKGFRISPISRRDLYSFVDSLMMENGINQHSTREVRFFHTSIPPWSVHLASNVTFGLEV